MKRERNKLYVISTCVALALATVIAYEPVRHNNFVAYDDASYVTENPNVDKGITRESILWAFTTGHASNWHPLTWLSHMLDCQFFGLNPTGHHIINLFFHIANTLLLFWILKRMTGAIWRSAFVAAAFALHPLHVESVAWVAERKDVLSGLFWMLTMAAYVRYTEQPRTGRYLLIVLAFCLGLMSKPMLVTLPFVLLLLDYWPLGRFQPGHTGKNVNRVAHKSVNTCFQWPVFYCLAWEKIPFFVLSAVSSVITFLAQRSWGAMSSIEELPAGARVANAFISYIRYIGKMFWPSRLALFYPHPHEKILMWQAVISVLLLLAISICIIRLARKHKYLPVGWLWYLWTLVPVIGIVQVGSQAMADRYTYLPSIGIFIMVGWGAAEILGEWRYRKIAFGIAGSVVLAVLLMCTRKQVGYWQDSFALFGHALEVTENNSIIHNNLGCELRDKGRLEEAVMHFDEALRIHPHDLEALSNKGKTFLDMGKTDEAIVIFTKAVGISEKPYEAYNDLCLSLEKEGKINEAVKQWQKAVQLKFDYDKAREALRTQPGLAEAHYNLGGVYVRQGKLELAVEQYAEALRLKPDYLTARVSLARTLLKLGQIQSAIEQYYKILQLKPDDLEVLNNLAWLLATAEDTRFQNPNDAVKFAQRACELAEPANQLAFLDTLAAAYAAAGNFPEAVKTAERAIKSAEAAGKKDLVLEIQKRLELYKAGQPYRQK